MKPYYEQDGVTIYWPFALCWQAELMRDDLWSVTHLPSGRFVMGRLSRRAALKLIRMLRAERVNWDTAKLGKAAIEAARSIVLSLRRYQK